MPSASTNVLPLAVSAIFAGAAICDDAIDVPRTRTADTAVNAIVFFMTPTPGLVASLPTTSQSRREAKVFWRE
jgi:hypothetical protein